LERISRTTCSIFSATDFSMSENNRCASSKKKTSFGFSGSPTSGKRSNSSASIQSRNVAYTFGDCCISFSAGENVDHAAAVLRLDQVIQIERWLAKKFVAALRFKREQVALNRSCTRRRDVAILCLKLRRIIRDVLDHRAQILQVEQQQTGVVGDLEDHVQHAGLGVVKI
jgi:hypothetical protein